MAKRTVGPILSALVAHVAPKVKRPRWANDLPIEVAALLDLALAVPRLGRWSCEPKADASLVRAATKKKHAHWICLGTDGMQWLFVGWSKPDDLGRIYIVDDESREVTPRGSIEAALDLEILDDPIAIEDTPDLVNAVEAALAAKRAAAKPPTQLAGFSKGTYKEWDAPELQPPDELAASLASKGHVRWLWHRELGAIASVTAKSIRAMINGKAKGIGFPWSHYVEVAMAPDGKAVWAVSTFADEPQAQRLDLTTGKWTIFAAGKHKPTGVGCLADGSLALVDRETSGVRIVRPSGSALKEITILPHEAMPEPGFAHLLSSPDLPFVVVHGTARDRALLVRLDGKTPVLELVPHKVNAIRRYTNGWLVGTSADVWWYR